MDRPSAEDQLAAKELVALVEVAHPLPEECARHRDVLVGPDVERGEALDVPLVPEVPPEIQVGRRLGGRPDELEAGADHRRRHRAAERIDHAVDVEVFPLQPLAEEPAAREIDRPGHVDEVPHGHFGMGGNERGGQRPPHAVAQHAQLSRGRRL